MAGHAALDRHDGHRRRSGVPVRSRQSRVLAGLAIPPAIRPGRSAGSQQCQSTFDQITLEVGDDDGSYSYTIDTSHLPAAVQGLTLSNMQEVFFHDRPDGMNVGGISALFNDILVDYSAGKIGLRPKGQGVASARHKSWPRAGTRVLITPWPHSSPDMKTFLVATPFFGGLSDASLDLLVSMLVERRFDPGATIVAEGEPGRSMYVVHSGELAVSKRGDAGHIIRMSRLEAGDFFGEMT